jgi:hypothetical protein
MIKTLVTSILLTFFSTIHLRAQDITSYSRKGQTYIYWGYNRTSYANSDISFKGIGYEFTLHDIDAADRPTSFTLHNYFDITNFTIPQFNFHFGYFIKDQLCLQLGWDHMKYVMREDQNSHISGHISAQVSNPSIEVNPKYVGDFQNSPIKVDSSDFLIFEHTDGFNYASLELDRYTNLWKAKNNKQGVDWLVGGGIGLIVPRTDVHLFKVGQNNYWNIAGYGISLKTGFRTNLLKRVFLQTDMKGGFTSLSRIRTTGRESDSASQNIWFLESYFALGYTFGK